MTQPLDISKMVDNFNDPIYIKYKSLINDCGGHIIFNKKDKLIIDKYEITPPQIVDIFFRNNEIEKERKKTLMSIYRMQEQILHSQNPKAYKDDYNYLVETLQTLDEEYETLRAYYLKINHYMYGIQLETLRDEINNTISSMNRLYNKLENEVYIDKSNLKKLVKKNSEILLKKQQLKHLEDFARITFYISELPKIKLGTKEMAEEQPVKTKTIEKKSKASKLTDDQKGQIYSNIKHILKDKFKFGSTAECISKAKSKPYFMSKEEILKIIESNPEIKIAMPPNYKTLNKDELCSYLSE